MLDQKKDAPAWLLRAFEYVGLAEIKGPKSNPKIMDWAERTNLTWQYTDDAIPWCAVAVNGILDECGLPGTNSAMARSFLNYGTALTKPRLGAITVLRRGNPPSGHVAFFIRWNDDKSKVLLLGGNQGDKVSYAWYPAADILGHRWPQEPEQEPVPPQMPARPVPTDRRPAMPQQQGDQHQEVAAEELRQDRSRIFTSAERAENAARKGLVGVTFTGVSVWLSERFDVVAPLIGKLEPYATALWNLMPVILAAALAYALYELARIKWARVDDHRTGRTTRRKLHD